jgi:MoaA/NifB/PqqE/SkfB family radical SAM enzyme
MRRPMPWAVSFLVTARCVLRCRHCFYHYDTTSSAEELTTDEYDRLSQSLGRLGVALYCGGEPYLRPDLADIVNLVRARNGAFVSSATSNGQLTSSVVDQTHAILRAWPASPFLLGISIEGPEAVHDAIRGAGSYARAIRTYRECVALRRHFPNLALSVTTVLSTMNEREAPGFVRWAARALEPTSHVVLLARQHPRGGDELKAIELDHYRAAQREALRTMRAGSPWGRLRPDAFYLDAVYRHVEATRRTGRRSFHCWAGVHGALVGPAGHVHACEVLGEHPEVPALGSLRSVAMDLRALWDSPAAERACRSVNHHDACRACTHETMGHAVSLVYPPNLRWPPA